MCIIIACRVSLRIIDCFYENGLLVGVDLDLNNNHFLQQELVNRQEKILTDEDGKPNAFNALNSIVYAREFKFCLFSLHIRCSQVKNHQIVVDY